MRKKTQIRRVRAVSMVALYAEEAFFVTVTPKPLKKAIVKHTATLRRISVLLSP
jgi:hypothetical protein